MGRECSAYGDIQRRELPRAAEVELAVSYPARLPVKELQFVPS